MFDLHVQRWGVRYIILGVGHTSPFSNFFVFTHPKTHIFIKKSLQLAGQPLARQKTPGATPRAKKRTGHCDS